MRHEIVRLLSIHPLVPRAVLARVRVQDRPHVPRDGVGVVGLREEHAVDGRTRGVRHVEEDEPRGRVTPERVHAREWAASRAVILLDCA